MMIPLCYDHVTNFIKCNQRAKPDPGRLSWRSLRHCRLYGRDGSPGRLKEKTGALAIRRRPVPYLRRNVLAELSVDQSEP